MRITRIVFWVTIILSYLCLFLILIINSSLTRDNLTYLYLLAIGYSVLIIISFVLLISNFAVKFLKKEELLMAIFYWVLSVSIPICFMLFLRY